MGVVRSGEIRRKCFEGVINFVCAYMSDLSHETSLCLRRLLLFAVPPACQSDLQPRTYQTEGIMLHLFTVGLSLVGGRSACRRASIQQA